MIASPHTKHDTFDIKASGDHVNYDTLDTDVLENTVKMHTLCRPGDAKHINMQYLGAVTLYDSLPSRKIRHF